MNQKQRPYNTTSILKNEVTAGKKSSSLGSVKAIFIISLVTLLISSCGRKSEVCPNGPQDGERQSCKEAPPRPTSNESDSDTDDGDRQNDGHNPGATTEALLHQEEVTNKIGLHTLRLGDVLTFEIQGTKIIPQFSQVYTRAYSSSWIKYVCLPWKNRGRRCFDFPLNGTCLHKLRDKLDDKREDIKILDDLKDLRLRLKIGNASFSLGKIIKREDGKVTTRLRINEAMLETGDFSELIVEQYPLDTIKVGLQGFGPCDGQGQRNFVTTGPTDSSNFDAQVKQSFIVSVLLEYN